MKNIAISDEMHKKVRIYAAEKEKMISEIVDSAIDYYVNNDLQLDKIDLEG